MSSSAMVDLFGTMVEVVMKEEGGLFMLELLEE